MMHASNHTYGGFVFVCIMLCGLVYSNETFGRYDNQTVLSPFKMFQVDALESSSQWTIAVFLLEVFQRIRTRTTFLKKSTKLLKESCE
jgi:hypothetical protein